MRWFESDPQAPGGQELRAPPSGGDNSLLLPLLLMSLGQLGQHPGGRASNQNPLDTLFRLAQIQGVMQQGDSARQEERLRQQLGQGLLGDLQPGQAGPPAPYDENAGFALATQLGPEMLNAWRALRPALEAQGRVPHPDAMKQKVEAQGWAERAPGIARGLAPTASMSEDDIRSVAANVPPANLAALLTLPSKQALTDEQVKAMQAKFPTIAPMAEATLGKTQEQRKKIKKETEFVGKPKAGRSTEKDKDVEALAKEMRQVGQEQADQMVKKSALLNLGVPNPLHLRAYQAAFGQGQQIPSGVRTPRTADELKKKYGLQ